VRSRWRCSRASRPCAPSPPAPGDRLRAHPTCLARASRDQRLCAAAIAAERPTCSALVLGDPDKCAGNTVCLRQVARWQTLIEKPTDHRPFLTQARLDLRGSEGTPDPATPSLDLTDAAQQGAVVDASRRWPHQGDGGLRFAALGGSHECRCAAKAAARDRRFPADLGKASTRSVPARIKIDLFAPNVQERAFTTIADAKLTSLAIGPETGSPIRIALAATLYEAPKKYAVKIESRRSCATSSAKKSARAAQNNPMEKWKLPRFSHWRGARLKP